MFALAVSYLAVTLIASAANPEGVVGWPMADGATSEPLLVLGIRQVADGDFEAAVFSLDSAARKLQGQPARTAELVQAYLYLGAAYVGLDHEEAAKGKFREALKLGPSLRLSPEQFPPKVMLVFESQVLAAAAAQRKHGARRFLILGGVGAAGALGVVAATKDTGAPSNRPPGVSTPSVQPQGAAIPGVTTVTFTASADDRDGDPLTFNWTFGDGSSAPGQTVSHVYSGPGVFTAELTVTDGQGGTSKTQTTVVVRSLGGPWRVDHLPTQITRLQCTQDVAALDCVKTSVTHEEEFHILRLYGTVSHPRQLVVNVLTSGFRPDLSSGICRGEVLPNLDCLRCIYPAGTLLMQRLSGGSCQ